MLAPLYVPGWNTAGRSSDSQISTFIEEGLGEISDRLAACEVEIEPIAQRLIESEPRSLADQALVAQALAKELGYYLEDEETTGERMLHARLMVLLGAITRHAPAQVTVTE